MAFSDLEIKGLLRDPRRVDLGSGWGNWHNARVVPIYWHQGFETTICMLIIDFLMKNHHISKLSAVIKIYAYFVIFYFQQSQLRTHVDVF